MRKVLNAAITTIRWAFSGPWTYERRVLWITVASFLELDIMHFFICSYLRDQSSQLSIVDVITCVTGFVIICTVIRGWPTGKGGVSSRGPNHSLRLTAWLNNPWYGLLPFKAAAARLGLPDLTKSKPSPRLMAPGQQDLLTGPKGGQDATNRRP